MARQYLSEKKVAKIRRITGRPYVLATNRGGSGPWWLCQLPNADPGDRRMNADYVNWKTWEVEPAYRGGLPVFLTPDDGEDDEAEHEQDDH